jgi:RNA polymerase sigma-70 factor (ECF subfamily)
MDPDRELMRACAGGDARARDEFVGRFAPLLFGTVRRALGGKPRDASLDVEDVVQEVFLRLFKDGGRLLRTYDPAKGSPSTWLTIVARSSAIDIARRKILPAVPFEPDVHDPSQGRAESPGERFEIPEGLLPPKQRLAMHLLFEKGCDVRESARAMGVTEQRVRSLKHLALEKLRSLQCKEPLGKDEPATAGG